MKHGNDLELTKWQSVLRQCYEGSDGEYSLERMLAEGNPDRTFLRLHRMGNAIERMMARLNELKYSRGKHEQLV